MGNDFRLMCWRESPAAVMEELKLASCGHGRNASGMNWRLGTLLAPIYLLVWDRRRAKCLILNGGKHCPVPLNLSAAASVASRIIVTRYSAPILTVSYFTGDKKWS